MRKIVAANWKMHFTLQQAAETAQSIKELIQPEGVSVILCPPFVYLRTVHEILHSTPIAVGAQNMYHEEKGAFTGEISPIMLLSIGCEYVIIGHSERRHIFNEDNNLINMKINSAIKHGLKPILCVGETLNERKNGLQLTVVKEQLESALDGIDSKGELIVAYEPVWAIGTGVAADVDTISKMHAFIRSIVDDTPILYGGSVKPENASELSAIEDVDGFLVGSASLDAKKFAEIIDKFRQVKGV